MKRIFIVLTTQNKLNFECISQLYVAVRANISISMSILTVKLKVSEYGRTIWMASVDGCIHINKIKATATQK